MKFLDWFSGKGAAVAEPPAHKQAAERAIPAGQIVGVHGFGSLQEPDLRHDCPYCHHVLTENGSKGPRLRFDTIEATGKTAMSCPHCKHEITSPI